MLVLPPSIRILSLVSHLLCLQERSVGDRSAGRLGGDLLIDSLPIWVGL